MDGMTKIGLKTGEDLTSVRLCADSVGDTIGWKNIGKGWKGFQNLSTIQNGSSQFQDFDLCFASEDP